LRRVCLGIIFGPGTDQVAGCWRKICNNEFHNLYFSGRTVNYGSQIKLGDMWVEEIRSSNTVLFRKSGKEGELESLGVNDRKM
jgi:hypothetical protein